MHECLMALIEQWGGEVGERRSQARLTNQQGQSLYCFLYETRQAASSELPALFSDSWPDTQCPALKCP